MRCERVGCAGLSVACMGGCWVAHRVELKLLPSEAHVKRIEKVQCSF